MRTMAAAKFKAHCLAVMDEVQSKREPVVITKNGKAIVRMVPLDVVGDVDPLDAFRIPGVEIVGDIMSPMYTDEENEEFFQRSLDQLRDVSR